MRIVIGRMTVYNRDRRNKSYETYGSFQRSCEEEKGYNLIWMEMKECISFP